MTTTTHPPHPIRADLVTAVTMYYPVVEQSRFPNINAMCKATGVPLDRVRDAVAHAAANRSDTAVLDFMRLGDREHKVCGVLVQQPGGAVILCCGLFGEASEDRAEVLAFIVEIAASREFAGKFLAIGEYRGIPRGMLQ